MTTTEIEALKLAIHVIKASASDKQNSSEASEKDAAHLRCLAETLTARASTLQSFLDHALAQQQNEAQSPGRT